MHLEGKLNGFMRACFGSIFLSFILGIASSCSGLGAQSEVNARDGASVKTPLKIKDPAERTRKFLEVAKSFWAGEDKSYQVPEKEKGIPGCTFRSPAGIEWFNDRETNGPEDLPEAVQYWDFSPKIQVGAENVGGIIYAFSRTPIGGDDFAAAVAQRYIREGLKTEITTIKSSNQREILFVSHSYLGKKLNYYLEHWIWSQANSCALSIHMSCEECEPNDAVKAALLEMKDKIELRMGD